MNVRLSQFLAVDPGVEFGWAWFPYGATEPAATGVENPYSGDDWFVRTGRAAKILKLLLSQRKATFVAMEWPLFLEGNKGIATAESGSLIKLATVVGRFVQVIEDRNIQVHPVGAIKWKGQRDDPAVQAAVKRRLGTELCRDLAIKSHAWDAVAIGLWVRGEMS